MDRTKEQSDPVPANGPSAVDPDRWTTRIFGKEFLDSPRTRVFSDFYHLGGER